MSVAHTKRTSVAIAALLAAGLVGQACAGGFLLREQSAVATGVATAGAAAGGAGLGSMYWNAATMTNYGGLQSSSTITGILPGSEITATGGSFYPIPGVSRSSRDLAPAAAVGASYYSYQLNEQFWIGLAVNSPFGLVTRNPVVWTGSQFGGTSRVSSLDLNPSVAYKVNSWLSVAVGLQALYFNARLSPGLTPPPGVIEGKLKGDSWGAGVTAGITITPIDGTQLGFGYRSTVRERLEGTFTTPTGLFSPAALTVNTPDVFSVGLRQTINPSLTLLAGFEYDHWRLRTIPVSNGYSGALLVGGAPLNLAFNYKDGWMVSLGGEYKWNDAWTMRAGVAFDRSPIDNSNRTPTLPDTDRIWASIGASYQISSRMSVDVGYAHVFGRSATINVTTLPTFTATTHGHVDLLSASLNMRFDMPSTPALVAKY